VKISPNDAIALKAVLQHDLGIVRRLEQRLGELLAATGGADETGYVTAAYYLHNLYGTLENSFDQISRTFENHVKDPSRWHQELLDKMFLDLSPLRPPVLPEHMRGLLHDLRGFRHIFRHGYGLELDPSRLRVLWERWHAEGHEVASALDRFCAELARPAE
jgi:hypothetical protein